MIDGFIIEYNARTAEGVSGAPVNIGGKAAAVHYAGVGTKANRAHPLQEILPVIQHAFQFHCDFLEAKQKNAKAREEAIEKAKEQF